MEVKTEVTTFADDLLERKEFASRLEKFIAVEQDYVQGSLVIALSSKFGSGKTSFLKMWSDSLAKASQEEEKPLVIFLNAWESDYYGDPLYAVVSALIHGLKKEGGSPDGLISAAKYFGWFAAAVGGQIVNRSTGFDAVAAVALAERKKAGREDAEQTLADTFSIYEGRKEAMAQLKSAIQTHVKAKKPNVLFMVDELDRCRPDYAISYLETIKHIFDIKGAVFLLAADRRQLENSAKTAFGADLDFEEYLRKFIHREVTLPEITEAGYSRLASEYVKFYLEREGSRYCLMKLDHTRIEDISALVAALELTPRQIQEIFRILGHIFSTTEKNRGHLLWGLAVGTILMAALKIGRHRMFQLLGSQGVGPQEAFDFLFSLLGDENVGWWFRLLLTGGALKIEEVGEVEEIMQRVGLLKEGDTFVKWRELNQWSREWGYSRSSRFVEIREKIEQISQWN